MKSRERSTSGPWQSNWPVSIPTFVSVACEARALCCHDFEVVRAVCLAWRALFSPDLCASAPPRDFCMCHDRYQCAVASGSVGLVEWMRRELRFDPLRALDSLNRPCVLGVAARGGHVEMIAHLRSLGCPWEPEACTEAAAEGNLEVLKFLHESGCPWGERTCQDALIVRTERSVECFRYARENGASVYSEHARVLDVVNGLSSGDEDAQINALNRVSRAIDEGGDERYRDGLMWSGVTGSAISLLRRPRASARVREAVLRTLCLLLELDHSRYSSHWNPFKLLVEQHLFDGLAQVLLCEDSPDGGLHRTAVSVVKRFVERSCSTELSMGLMSGIVPLLLSHLSRNRDSVDALEALSVLAREMRDEEVSWQLQQSMTLLTQILATSFQDSLSATCAARVVFKILSAADKESSWCCPSLEVARDLLGKPPVADWTDLRHWRPVTLKILEQYPDDPDVSSSRLAQSVLKLPAN